VILVATLHGAVSLSVELDGRGLGRATVNINLQAPVTARGPAPAPERLDVARGEWERPDPGRTITREVPIVFGS
jgi:hypothetical protein